MPYAFLPLCDNTAAGLSALSVRDDEDHLIAPNAQWIVQALLTPDSVTYGLYDDGKAAGMISILDPRAIDEDERDDLQPGCIFVWRVMVDRHHRGKGLGRALIDFAQGYSTLIGLGGISLTTMDRHPGNALPLYIKLGFEPTGRRVHDEIELIRLR